MGWKRRTEDCHTLLMKEAEMSQPLWITGCSYTFKHISTYDPEIIPLGIYPQETKNSKCPQTASTRMFGEALTHKITKLQATQMCADRRMDKHTVDYSLGIKRTVLLICAKTWKDLKNIMLREKRHKGYLLHDYIV